MIYFLFLGVVMLKKLIKALQTDKEYRRGWQANLSMAFKDEYDRCHKKYKTKIDIHYIANKAACNFLRLLTETQKPRSWWSKLKSKLSGHKV